MIQIFIYIIFLLTTSSAFCDNDTIGSDSAPSRQSYYEFSGFNNRIAGFAAMEQGFSLQDQNTTCTFDSTFPVNYFVNLNHGTLYLNNHLNCDEHTEIPNSVNIYCNDYDILFPHTYNSESLTIPSLGNFSEIKNTTLSAVSYSLDWSYDDKYIAINSGASLEIYYFEDNTVTLTASTTLAGTINTLEWQPNNYKIAIGRLGSGNTLAVYKWNVHNGTISLVNSVSPGTAINSVSWHPTGNYVACLRSTSNELYLYSFNGTSLTFLTSIDIPGGTRTSYLPHLLSWRSDGKYLASGYYQFAGQPELYIHSFNGLSLTLSASAEVDNFVIGLDWSPTDSLIAVGLWSTTENLRVFQHNANAGSLIELTSARMGVTQTVRNVDWRSDGKYLGFAKFDGAGNEYQALFWDEKAKILNSAAGYNLVGAHGYSLKWSNNQKNIAACGSSRNFRVFEFVSMPISIYDGNLIFNSDVNITNTITLSNKCQIDGNNNKISFEKNGNILVDTNSTVTLKNIIFENVKSNKIGCLDNTGKIIFDNVTLNLNNKTNFQYGSFEIENKLKISGEYHFSYQTTKQSKINSGAILELKDGATLSYEPNSNNNNLIILQDSTSQIYLNEATLHSTTTGIQLTKGTLKVKGLCFIDSDAITKAQAVKFGDGLISGNNLNINIEPESNLNLINGYWTYKNVN
ncbi:MAG: hypothetical protein ABIA74_00635 [bacterium]